MARRAGLQLLAGVLIVAAIPIVSTVRILNANALRNERAHTDTTLRTQLQTALHELSRGSDDASTRADDLAQSPAVQQAFIAGDRAAIRRLAAKHPDVDFFIGGHRIAGPAPSPALKRSVWLTVNGRRIGELVTNVRLDHRLAKRLAQGAPHAAGDRLLIVRGGLVVGTGEKIVSDGRTVRHAGESYRALSTSVPDARGVRLVALRPEKTISATIAPYRNRIEWAAIASFALLVLVAITFAGPILRMLGDFRRVASQATTDALTDLPNRRSFDEELALEWRRAQRIHDALALILLDLDEFKSINDTYGHQAGDHVLCQVGRVLGGGVRQLDLPARYGGEEFAVLVPETQLAEAVDLAERLRGDLEAAHIELPDGRTFKVTASFGVAAMGSFERAEELVAAADEALYEAKRNGKNRVSAATVPGAELDSPPQPADRRRTPSRKAPAKKAHAKKPAAKRKPAAKKKSPTKKPSAGGPRSA